jgi:hypothetical protein
MEWRRTDVGTTSSIRLRKTGWFMYQNSTFWHVNLFSFTFSIFQTPFWILFWETDCHIPEACLNRSGNERHRYTKIEMCGFSEEGIILLNEGELILVRLLISVRGVWLLFYQNNEFWRVKLWLFTFSSFTTWSCNLFECLKYAGGVA